jgi:hypothetical protein
MTDPVTALTASGIASLAFQEFIKSGAGELAKKFTAEAISKMSALRTLIWEKLRGKHAIAEEALQKAETGDENAIEVIGTFLGTELLLDPDFAKEVHAIANIINAGKIQDNSSMVQNNSGNARGWQTKVEGGTAYIGEIKQYGVDYKSEQK